LPEKDPKGKPKLAVDARSTAGHDGKPARQGAKPQRNTRHSLCAFAPLRETTQQASRIVVKSLASLIELHSI